MLNACQGLLIFYFLFLFSLILIRPCSIITDFLSRNFCKDLGGMTKFKFSIFLFFFYLRYKSIPVHFRYYITLTISYKQKFLIFLPLLTLSSWTGGLSQSVCFVMLTLLALPHLKRSGEGKKIFSAV